MGQGHTRAKGRLPRYHPLRRPTCVAQQHAWPIRPHIPAPASPSKRLWRVHHPEFSSAETSARLPDRHVEVDGQPTALARGRRTRRPYASVGYGADVVVACCDAAVHSVRSAFSTAQIELTGGGGTDIRKGIHALVRRPGLDLLVVVTDCRTPWPDDAPPLPVITIRVGDGEPAAWATRGSNRLITIED